MRGEFHFPLYQGRKCITGKLGNRGKIKVSNEFKLRATTTYMITTKHRKIRETFVTTKDKNKNDNSIE